MYVDSLVKKDLFFLGPDQRYGLGPFSLFSGKVVIWIIFCARSRRWQQLQLAGEEETGGGNQGQAGPHTKVQRSAQNNDLLEVQIFCFRLAEKMIFSASDLHTL